LNLNAGTEWQHTLRSEITDSLVAAGANRDDVEALMPGDFRQLLIGLLVAVAGGFIGVN
jgi:hypothetical protein